MKENSSLVYDNNLANPIVTIGIPAYKNSILLKEAIESALLQDFDKAYEILVVNDNPYEDSITQLMTEYLKYGNVAYYKNAKNLGPTGNWNAMYSLAKGQYVVMLQDDDLLMPFYLKVMFRFMEVTSYQYDLIYPQQYLIKERGGLNPPPPIGRIRYRLMKLNDYIVTQWGLPTGLMIEKNKYFQTGGYRNELFPINDQEFIYRALHYVKGCQIQLPLCFYYIGENLSMKPEIITQSIVEAKNFNKVMQKDKSNIWRFFAPLCLRQQIINLERWALNFSQEQAIILHGRKLIGINRNKLKDKLSDAICKMLKLYIYSVRFKSFYIE